MEIDIIDILSKNQTLLLFLIIGLGYLVGNIRIGPVDIGATTGVLLIGLVLGHFGFPSDSDASAFGFALFIFSVGLQAGPSFFSALAEDGRKYIALAIVVSLSALSLAIAASKLMQFEFGLNAGLLAGALTSTPTLAGAQDAITSGLAELPEGMTAAQVLNNISVGYAITYIFGTVGLILFIRFFPVLLGINLPAQARELAIKKGILKNKGGLHSKAENLPVIRAYRIDSDDASDKTIEQRKVELGLQVTPLRLRRGLEFFEPDPELVLKKGDVISIIGSLKAHQEIQAKFGQEVLDTELLNYQITSKEIVVIQDLVVGKFIRDIKATVDYGCFVIGLTRASIELPVEDNLILHKGDRLHVVGEEEHLRKLSEKIGHIEEEIEETDLVSFSFGIVFGILLGMVLWKFGDISIGLGSAGGLLITGILIGFFSSIRPTFGRVPSAARFILMEIGLMIFMTSVGLKAGAGIWDALMANGLAIIGCGILVTLVPSLIGYAFGHYVLKMNPALLFGSITGSMTSTPSLKIATSAAKSSIPALGYAGTYTFANVFLTFSGSLIMMI